MQEKLTKTEKRLRVTEEQKENVEMQLRTVQQQLKEKNQQEANLLEQLWEKDQQEENSQRQLREMQQQLQHFQGQLYQKVRQEALLHEQLRAKKQQEESLRKQFLVREQQLQGQLRVKELKEEETAIVQARFAYSQQQVNNLERQLRDRDQDFVILNKTLSEAKENLKKYESQETHDWIIPREEIVMTDKRLGSGGWGYVVEGKYCGCTVAVKMLFDQFAISPLNRKKFEREMDIASKCRHPCLLQFIGATNDEESPLFVTELMESSLRTLLKQRTLSTTEVFNISLDVALALSYLHQKKPTPILHRDVSSANVLLWRRGDQWRGKVSDYGTARFLEEAMTTGPGALSYSAPEASCPSHTVKVSHKKCFKIGFFLSSCIA